MGLFGKKKKLVPCPVCGKDMDPGILSNSKQVKDGMICHACELMLRGEYDLERYIVQKVDLNNRVISEREKSTDPVSSMTIEEIKEIISQIKADQAQAIASHGGDYQTILTVEDLFVIAPKPLEVGLKRAKQLKNKVVVRGLVQSGEFKIDDSALIVHNGSETATSILDVIPCGGVSDFNTELAANMHKKAAAKDINAWLILDAEGGVEKGDLIAIR